MNLSFLHLSTTDRGGAGIAAQRIHANLMAEGHRSRMFIDHGTGGPGIQLCKGLSAAASRTASKAVFRAVTRSRFYFRDQRYDRPNAEPLIRQMAETRPDVIMCHAISNFLSFPSVARLAAASRAPVLWSLMDMASFTGGCHYASNCGGYGRGCGNCPAIPLRSSRDWSAQTVREKANALAQMRTVVVAPSTSLAEQARSSTLFAGVPVQIVPLSVPPGVFQPRDPAAYRARLQLAADRPVLFFGARQHSDPRKGMAVLEDALGRLAGLLPEAALPTLLIAGDGASFTPLESFGYRIRQLGLVTQDQLAQAYAAADVFVSPSLEDSGPMMINEAVMSGAPVIAFPIGVALDLVDPGVTGTLVPLGNAEALAEAMADMLCWERGRMFEARRRAREIGLARCSPEAQAGRLASLTLELMCS